MAWGFFSKAARHEFAICRRQEPPPYKKEGQDALPFTKEWGRRLPLFSKGGLGGIFYLKGEKR